MRGEIILILASNPHQNVLLVDLSGLEPLTSSLQMRRSTTKLQAQMLLVKPEFNFHPQDSPQPHPQGIEYYGHQAVFRV